MDDIKRLNGCIADIRLDIANLQENMATVQVEVRDALYKVVEILKKGKGE